MAIPLSLIIVIIVSATICFHVAKNKKLNAPYWAFAGCLLRGKRLKRGRIVSL
jgi:hypothetical protein